MATGRPYGRRDRGAVPYRPPAPADAGYLVNTKLRIHAHIHRALHERAAAEGLSVSGYMARLIAKDNGLPDPFDTPSRDQEELPLKSA